MSEPSYNSVERRIAHETKEKFELYLLSLVFTLLALAIQSASFGASLIKDSLELVAWGALLLSGIFGLLHLQWNPVLRVQAADRQSREDEILKLKEMKLKGQSEILVVSTGDRQSIDQRIKNHEDALNIYDPVIEKLEHRTELSYDLHWRLFLLGLVLAISSRGYLPASAVWNAIAERLS